VANGRAAITSRRFPPPWSVEETDACFIVRDANGQALYFEDTSRDRNRPTMAREAEEEGNKARPRRGLFDSTFFEEVSARRWRTKH
jgi:hypothetical protein